MLQFGSEDSELILEAVEGFLIGREDVLKSERMYNNTTRGSEEK